MSKFSVARWTDALKSRSLNRRGFVTAAGATAVTAYAGVSAQAQQATPIPAATPAAEAGFGQDYLFVQTFAGGSLAPTSSTETNMTVTVSGTPTTFPAPDYTLTLHGHIGQTIYFSDRPARVFGEAPTPTFLDNLGFTPVDPPNAALVTTSDSGETIAVIVELLNPVYDEATGDVTYQANILAGYDGEGLKHIVEQSYSSDLPADFGAGSLFIDNCPNTSLNCYYMSGASCKLIGTIGVGTCWSWYDLACNLCTGPADSCNSQLSDCEGNCEGVLTSGTQPYCGL